MRGVYCDGSSIRLRHDLPEPVEAEAEVMLRTRAVGICDTDLQLARGYMGFRGVLGHEFLALDPRGRRVTAEINNACHACPTCAAGHPGHCPNRTVLGIFRHDGAMADRVCVPARNLHVIPPEIDDRAAVFIEPLAAALRIIEQVDVDRSTRAAVLGDGKLGVLCAWVLEHAGAEVTLIGKHPSKLALAGDRVATALADEPPSARFDLVVDATGSATGLASVLKLVRPLGTVVLKTTIAGPHATELAPIVIDEVRLIGSRCGPFPKAIEALRSKAFDVERLIGAEFSLDRAEAAFHAAAEAGAKKVLLWIS